MHLGMVTEGDFAALSSNHNGAVNLLNRIAGASLVSENRKHLSQLVFSGGSSLRKTATTAYSSYGSVVYDSPQCSFDTDPLFPDGRKWPGRARGLSKLSA